MIIQNNLVISFVWKFQSISDDIFYINLPTNKNTKYQNFSANINYFIVNFLVDESNSKITFLDL